MSPNVFRSKNKINNQNFIKKNLDYVGENFTYETRFKYYKNKKVYRGIYGTANKKDLKELKEEGIEVEAMPWIKKYYELIFYKFSYIINWRIATYFPTII